MNKFILFIALHIFSLNLHAEQVKINITAKVLDSTCTISSNSTDFVVNMNSGNLRGQDIGVPFGDTPFSISLDNCPESIKTAHVKFSAESDPLIPNLLKITSGSDMDAKGIAIGLYDSKKNNLNITSNNGDYPIDKVNNNNVFNFSAAYVKTSNDFTPGKVVAIAYFDITYD
ncbi:fimbrial protein [Winslowiella sp. 2C04]|uniref:fimbrial protein n=1 Tax=Winslowiella sp. 2C04 TaxID=3416179 RepID=UPI003CEA9846